MGNLKRYVALMDVYIYAESDEEAIKLAQNVNKNINVEGFSQFLVTELMEQPTGTLGNRPIDIKPNGDGDAD